MAKNKLTDFDPVADNNEDIAGISILGTAPPSNLDNALRAGWAILAKVNAGTDPVADTWTFGDPADLTKRVRLDAGNVTAGQTRVLASPDKNGTILVDSAAVFGNCRLVLDGSSLKLSPFNGNLLTINGAAYAVPSAGVTLAAPATNGTTYFIYAYMNSGTMTLEASTTGHATDSTTGVEIKSGDATRTLVGMARTVSSAWVDSISQRFVLSYFNRQAKRLERSFSADRTTTSTTFVEINSEIRTEFLAWGDEALWFSSCGAFSNSGTSNIFSRLALDGTSAWFAQVFSAAGTGFSVPLTMSAPTLPTEGYHYATILGKVEGATGTWFGTDSERRCFVFGAARG